MTDAKQAPQTVNRRLAAIQSLLRFGQAQEWCRAVPGPRTVRQVPPRPRWLARREQLALVRAVERAAVRRDIALVKMLLHTGLEIEEAAVTALADDRSFATQRAGHDNRQRAQAAARSLSMPRSAMPFSTSPAPLLPLKLNSVATCRSSGAGRAPDSECSLEDPERVTGRPPSSRAFAPTSCVTPFAVACYEAGVRIEEIAALAGHDSIETTRRYVEPGEDDLRKAVELLAGGED